MRVSPRKVLGLAVVVLLVAAVVWLQQDRAPVPAPDAPNFVLIIADDLGWNDVGAYGNTGIKTPEIDQLAGQGMRFANAFLTTSSCSPSRASILTGRYPHNTGAMYLHQSLDMDINQLLPGMLRNAGYYTALIGKWHLGDTAWRAFDQVKTATNDTDPSGAGDWVSALQERPENKPFFFVLAAIDPHPPYTPGETPNVHGLEDVTVPPYLVDTPGTRADFVQYYDEVARLDSGVGTVVAELKRQGVYDNTVIIFMSDNGRPFHRAKTTLYDSGIKTPFIVVWPRRIEPGVVNEQLISAVDIAPTLLELAGIGAAPLIQGVSMLPTMVNSDRNVREYIFAEHNWHGRDAHERAVRSLDYLYIENQWPLFGECRHSLFGYMRHVKDLLAAHRAGATAPELESCFDEVRAPQELYDVRADPFSLRNLAADPEYALTLKEYETLLRNWRDQTGDADFVPHPDPPK